MRKEITGNDLSKTTLKSLGLTGGMSAALRFFYKQPDVLKEQANVFVAPDINIDKLCALLWTIYLVSSKLQVQIKEWKNLKIKPKDIHIYNF